MRKYLIMFGALVCMATLWADNVRFAVDGPRQVIQGLNFLAVKYYIKERAQARVYLL